MRSRRGVPDEPDWKTLPSVTAKKLELSRLSEEEEQHCRRLSTNFSYSYKMAFRYVIFSNITECAGKEFSFDLVHNYSEAGHSVSFVCPVTRERLTTLYLWLGSVVSRRACRLVSYRARLWEQHQRSTLVAALNARPSGPKRGALLAQLRALGAGEDPQAQAILERDAARAAVLRARDAGRAARLALKAKQAAKARSEPFGAAAGLLAGKPRRAAVRLAIAKHPTFLKGGRGGESVGVLPPLVTSTLFI